MAEIDSLEIKIETSAKSSLEYLDKVQSKLNDITESLKNVLTFSSNLGKLGKIDLKGFEDTKKQLDSITEKARIISKQSVTPKVKTKEIEKAAKSLDDLFDKFQNAGRNLDLSNIGLSDLEKEAEQTEKTVKRLNDRLEKKISLEGTEKLGKSWESLVYDIQKATNQAEIYREAIGKIKSAAPKFTITRGENNISSESEVSRKEFVSPNSLNYNPEAMRMVFGEEAEGLKNFDDVLKKFGGTAAEASIKLNNLEEAFNPTSVNTYEAQIKRLKAELSNLASQGFKQGDTEYDEVAKNLAKVTAAKKKYDKEMSRSAQEENEAQRLSFNLKNIQKNLRSVENAFSKFGKLASKILKSVIKMAEKLKNALVGTQKQVNGMSFGRMIGSSVAFSFVFQGISAVQRAIKEGSDNLTQYSAEYNYSISSMVSALTYLKNSWTVAFAPIINIVAPYIQIFIEMISSALNAVGRFMAALTGKGVVVQSKKVWQDYGASLTETGSGAKDAADGINDATKAAKEFQSYTLGIDELNVQPQTSDTSNSNSGSSGSGIGGNGIDLAPSDMFETVKVEGSVAEFAKRLREAALAEDWRKLGKIIADGINIGMQKIYDAINWDNVGPRITYFANAFTETFNSIVDNINWDLMGQTIGEGINTIVNTFNQINGPGGINFYALGKNISKGIEGAIESINWKQLGKAIGNYFMISWDVLSGVVTKLSRKKGAGITGWSKLGKSIAESLNGVFESIRFSTIGQTFANGLNGAFDIVLNFSKTFSWEQFADNVINGINTFISKTNWSENGRALEDFMDNFFATLLDISSKINWSEFAGGIAQFLSEIDWAQHLSQLVIVLSKVFSELWQGLGETSAGKFVQAIINFEIAMKLLPFVNSIAKFFTGNTVFEILSSSFQNLFTTSASSGAATAATQITSSSGFATLKNVLMTALSSTAGQITIAIGGATIAVREFAKAVEKLQGGNGELTEMGAAFSDMTGALVDAKAITADEAEELFALKEQCESAGMSAEETGALYKKALEGIGVSSDDASRALATVESNGSTTKEMIDILSTSIEGLGTVSKNTSESINLDSIDMEEAYEGLEIAVSKIANQAGLSLDGITQLNNAFWDAKDSGATAQGAYEAVLEKAEDLGIDTRMAAQIVGEELPEALQTVSGSASLSAETLASLVGTFSNLGISITEGFIDNLSEQSPEIQQSVLDVFTAIQNGADIKATELATVFSTIGYSLPDSIVGSFTEMEPSVLASTLDMFMQIANGQAAKQDELLSIFQQMGITLVDEGLIKTLAGQGASVQQSTIQLLAQMESGKALSENQLVYSFQSLGVGIVNDGIISALSQSEPDVQEQAISLLSQIQSASESERQPLIDQFNSLGVGTVNEGLLSALDSMEYDTRESAINLLSQISGATEDEREGIYSQLKTVGIDASQGLLDGMGTKDYDITQAGIGLANSTLEGAKKGFIINSPSKAMYDIGVYAGMGLINGLNDAILNSQINVAIFVKFINSIISTIPDNMTRIFQTASNSIKEVLLTLPDFFRQVFTNAQKNTEEPFRTIDLYFHEKWDSVKNVFKDVKAFFKSAFESAYNAITSAFSGISGFFKGIANKIVDPIKEAINGVIRGMNWLLNEVGAGKSISLWTAPTFANGTDGIGQDTFGIVNDQKGNTYKELIVPPNGKAFIPEGRNVMLPLAKGTKIMPADETKAFLNGIPKFAKGIGDFFGGAWKSISGYKGSVLDYLNDPKGILQIATDKYTNVSGWKGIFGDMAAYSAKTLVDNAVGYVQKIFDEMLVVKYNPSAGVEQWRKLAETALRMTGQFSESNLDLLLYQMQTESGGNPNAINDWDINAQNGTPSKGLLQVIDPTFKSYAYPGYDTNIWDPLSNMLAAIRYTLSRYGSLANGWKGHGYAAGIGTINWSDLIPAYSVGGFPEDGLFMANHNELVGQFSNGKTAVANNENIQQGIKEGVKEAVAEILAPYLQQIAQNTRETADKDLSVNIGDREIAQANTRGRSRMGYSFTG